MLIVMLGIPGLKPKLQKCNSSNFLSVQSFICWTKVQEIQILVCVVKFTKYNMR